MKIKFSKNLIFILTADIILVCLSFYLSNLIRFDFDIPQWASEKFYDVILGLTIIKIITFSFFDLYRGMWRYTSLNDLWNVGKASVLSSINVILYVLFVFGFQGVSRSIFIIDWCLTLILIIGLRVATRIYFEKIGKNGGLEGFKLVILNIFRSKKRTGKQVVIIGAGNCGEKIVREIRDNASIQYNVVGFLDDDQKKIGKKIHGIPVIDKIDQIDHVVRNKEVGEIIIAIPSASVNRMREIVKLCKESHVRYRTVPNMGELINGRVTVNSIRDVEYRDLLRREPVNLDRESIGAYLSGKRVFVSGAGGSIGRELLKQICPYRPKELILFEIAESPLYEIDLQLKKDFSEIHIIPVLGDVQKKDEIEAVFLEYKPEIVFHAAAYKHVPMLEHHPWKAIENNIVGTQNMVEIADKYHCHKFVFVSTDKAVNPANIMGTSKRIAELIVQNKSLCNGSKTNFITVRFGNVIGSVGSVIPLFKKQIRDGGPVTVTHPDIIRFFMLIPEACQLILQSGAMGKGGEIFVLEMGEPVKIDDMAKDLIRFSGFEPNVDIQIEYTGLRPGEKLFEELMTQNEKVVPTHHDKILVFNSEKCEMGTLQNQINELIALADSRDKVKIQNMFRKIIPDYTPAQIN